MGKWVATENTKTMANPHLMTALHSFFQTRQTPIAIIPGLGKELQKEEELPNNLFKVN